MGYGTDGLTFNVLRAANKERVGKFKNKKGGKAHKKQDGSDWTPAQWLQAVMGELGEYANLRKKFERGDMSEEEFMIEAKKELADVQIYFDLLANRLRIDLGRAVIDKFNQKSEELDLHVFISEDGSDWHLKKNVILRNKINTKPLMRSLLYVIAVILTISWAVGYFAYNTGGLIHILLVIAVISVLLSLLGRDIDGRRY